MFWFVLISVILLVALIMFLGYLISRLYAYILKLEEIIKNCIRKNDNMFQSMKEMVHEDYLLDDGRLKKLMMPKEKNRIYNGIKVEDRDSDL